MASVRQITKKYPMYNVVMDLSGIAGEVTQHYKTTQAMVIAGLRQAILSGVLEEGQPIRQQAVAAEFGVSRIPVREALRELEGEGLVAFYPHRGAVVSVLSRQEAEEIIEIRISLEILALRKSMPRLGEEDLQRAEAVLEQTEREDDLHTNWGELNWRFHEALLAPARSPRLLDLIKEQHSAFERYIRVHLALIDYGKSHREHREILDRCRSGDEAVVERLLERHLRDTGNLLASNLKNDPGYEADNVGAGSVGHVLDESPVPEHSN